ncbi:hypothetical protein VNO78_07208 [Psophocarpus tetragonolobus]|uniref:Uncharacterized protein n=1 Tax=Psophocarpus tetragonolobus TaxID=3891 RepID=A0AAN9SUY4_PSOTE
MLLDQITAKRLHKDETTVLSTPILTSMQPPPTEVEKVVTSTLSLEGHWNDGQGEISELPENEVCPTSVQNDFPVVERLNSEESSSNSTDSDPDDPFNLVDEKLSVSGTMSLGDDSLVSVREAIDALELLLIKDLSEVSSDPDMQSQLDYFLNLLTKGSHPQVTAEVKEALVELQRKAFASLQKYKATIEPANKLQNFNKKKARIQEETSAGKNRRKDVKSSIKKASLVVKAENSRKKEIESEIADIRKQIDAKEMDLRQLVLNVENQEAELSNYEKNHDSLEELARALSKEADDLLAENKEIEEEGKAAEVKQNMLKSKWSTDLPIQLTKIKNNIFDLTDE